MMNQAVLVRALLVRRAVQKKIRDRVQHSNGVLTGVVRVNRSPNVGRPYARSIGVRVFIAKLAVRWCFWCSPVLPGLSFTAVDRRSGFARNGDKLSELLRLVAQCLSADIHGLLSRYSVIPAHCQGQLQGTPTHLSSRSPRALTWWWVSALGGT
jgi:hypothetical protein